MHESKQIVVSRGKCGDNQYHDMVHVYIAIINRPNIISFLGSMIAGVDCTRITIRHQARSIAFLHCADHVAVSLSRAFISNAFNLRVFSCEEKKHDTSIPYVPARWCAIASVTVRHAAEYSALFALPLLRRVTKAGWAHTSAQARRYGYRRLA